jgi:hypothetical protein
MIGRGVQGDKPKIQKLHQGFSIKALDAFPI